jgi:hypothetical protein
MRPLIALAVLAAVLVGGFFVAATWTIAGEKWPEW